MTKLSLWGGVSDSGHRRLPTSLSLAPHPPPLARCVHGAQIFAGRFWPQPLGRRLWKLGTHTSTCKASLMCQLNLEGGFLPGQVTRGRARQTAARMLLTPFRETDSGSGGASIPGTKPSLRGLKSRMGVSSLRERSAGVS